MLVKSNNNLTVYKDNNFYKSLLNVFKSSEFVTFKKNFINNETDVSMFYFFLMLYMTCSHRNLQPEEILNLVHRMVTDRDVRLCLIKKFTSATKLLLA